VESISEAERRAKREERRRKREERREKREERREKREERRAKKFLFFFFLFSFFVLHSSSLSPLTAGETAKTASPGVG
jgi:cell division septal protein FtsQ